MKINGYGVFMSSFFCDTAKSKQCVCVCMDEMIVVVV